MKTILLVDDEPEILSVLDELLSSFGYKVIAKLDAESALPVIKDGTTVDLVITDLKMPGMSGQEFVVALKQIVPAMPVIMLTAYGSVQSYIQSRSDGVFEYINKPIQSKELRRIVKAALYWAEAKQS